MNDLIIAKVSAALKGHWANPDLVWPLICATKLYKLSKKKTLRTNLQKYIVFSPNFDISMMSLFSKQVSNLQYEMLLLTDSISKEGGCWELRLRCGKPYFLSSSIYKMVYFFQLGFRASACVVYFSWVA